jgi:hypothetical protein
MNYRLNTKVIALVALLVVIAIVLFAYTLVSAPTETEVSTQQATTTTTQQEERLLSAKHQFVDGIHTIAGTVELPTPCHTLVAEPFFVDDASSTVEIRFSTALQGEECATVPTQVPFRVSFEAPEGVAIRATWDGAPVRLNLVPVAPGETLDGDVNMKG